MEQLLMIPKGEFEMCFQHSQKWSVYMLKESTFNWLTSHSCAYGSLVFTDSVLTLSDQVLYNSMLFTLVMGNMYEHSHHYNFKSGLQHINKHLHTSGSSLSR